VLWVSTTLREELLVLPPEWVRSHKESLSVAVNTPNRMAYLVFKSIASPKLFLQSCRQLYYIHANIKDLS
jgi:hypothetical protein